MATINGLTDSAVSRPPNPEREGGVPVAMASVVIVLLMGSMSVRIRTSEVLIVDTGVAAELVLLSLLGIWDTAAPRDTVNEAGGVGSDDVVMNVEARVVVVIDVALELVVIRLDEAMDEVTGEDEEDGVCVGMVPLFHVPSTHCVMSALSTRRPFWFVGVRLRTYDVPKLPAPQATRPVKTSELVLMNEFWAQNADMHFNDFKSVTG